MLSALANAGPENVVMSPSDLLCIPKSDRNECGKTMSKNCASTHYDGQNDTLQIADFVINSQGQSIKVQTNSKVYSERVSPKNIFQVSPPER